MRHGLREEVEGELREKSKRMREEVETEIRPVIRGEL